jgi:hypothetical protein
MLTLVTSITITIQLSCNLDTPEKEILSYVSLSIGLLPNLAIVGLLLDSLAKLHKRKLQNYSLSTKMVLLQVACVLSFMVAETIQCIMLWSTGIKEVGTLIVASQYAQMICIFLSSCVITYFLFTIAFL